MRMLCVDPGLRGCGVAEFQDGKLVFARYVENPQKTGRGYQACRFLGKRMERFINYETKGNVFGLVIIEHPRFYGSVHQKGDPNDTLDCGIVGGMVAAILHPANEVESVFPSDWKGQVPKQKMLARIKAAILPEELPRVQQTNKSDTEDILDAIGIGLWKLGRINARKIHND